MLAIIITGQSNLTVFGLTGIEKIIDVMANTRAILAIFEPTTFPTDISDCFWIAAMTLTNNSGADVPNDTSVTPITSLETLYFWAIEILPLIK